jgi:drug/metabolite transporter (DMT)-like permease
VADSAAANRGRLLIVIAALLWSTNGAFAKSLVAGGMDSLGIACARTFFAGVFLAGVTAAGRRPTSRAWGMMILVFCFATMNYAFVTAMTLTQAANAVFLQYTGPLWMILFSVVALREAVDRRSLVAMAGGAVGMAVLVIGNWSGTADEKLGLVLGLLAGFLYGGVAVSIRMLARHDNFWLATLMHIGAFALVAVAALLLKDRVWLSASVLEPLSRPTVLLAAMAFGIVQLAIPYCLFVRGLRDISAQEAGMLTLLEAVLSPVWTWLVVGEAPPYATLAGGGILLAALVIRYLPTRRSG